MGEMSTRETAVAVLGLVGGFLKWIGVCLLAMGAIWLAYSAIVFVPLLLIATAAYALWRSR